MFNVIFTAMRTTQKSIDACMLRQNVLSNNIANVDTPNFKRSDVRFEDVLKNAISNSSNSEELQNYINNTNPVVYKPNSNNVMRVDGNNVDIDAEMAQLAQNTIQYNMLIQQISGSFKTISSVINGGK